MSKTKYSEVDFYGNFCTMDSENISENFTYMDNEVKKYPNDLIMSAWFSDNDILQDYEMIDIDKYKNVPKSKMKEALEQGTIQYEGVFTSKSQTHEQWCKEMDEHIHFNAEFTYPLQSECSYINQLCFDINKISRFFIVEDNFEECKKRFLELYDRKYTTSSVIGYLLGYDKLTYQKVYCHEYYDRFESMIHKDFPKFKTHEDVMNYGLDNCKDTWVGIEQIAKTVGG